MRNRPLTTKDAFKKQLLLLRSSQAQDLSQSLACSVGACTVQKWQKTTAGPELKSLCRSLSTMSDIGNKESDGKDAAEDGAKPAEAVQDADCNGHAPAQSAAAEQPAEPEVLISPLLQLDAAHIRPNWTLSTPVSRNSPGFCHSRCTLAKAHIVHRADSTGEGNISCSRKLECQSLQCRGSHIQQDFSDLAVLSCCRPGSQRRTA